MGVRSWDLPIPKTGAGLKCETSYNRPGYNRSLTDLGDIPGMPTVLRKDGFNFVIYPDDHEPMHMHVKQAGKEVVIIT